MQYRITLLVLASLFLVSGCSTMAAAEKSETAVAVEPDKQVPEASEDRAAPTIITSLPPEVESFSYQGYRFLEDESDSYAIRYANRRKHRMADVFVYEVSEGNRELEHSQLVMGSTRATLRGLADAVKQGLYANFNVLGAATKARGVRTIARVETTYLRKNLATFGVLYQTEYNGTLIKVRVSMPDNDSNRTNREWDKAAEVLIENVINHLDQLHADAKPAAEKLPVANADEA